MDTNAQTEPVIGSDSPAADTQSTGQSPDELTKLRADLNKANKEAAERRVALKTAADELATLRQAQADAEAATLAEKGEFQKLHAAEKERAEKLAAQLAEMQAQIKAHELAALRHKVAAEKSLPAALVDRLRGETEEEIAADADELLAALPRPNAPDLHGGARGAGRGIAPAEASTILGRFGIDPRYLND